MEYCGCRCHIPIGPEARHADKSECLHCRIIGPGALAVSDQWRQHICDERCDDPNSPENRLLREIFGESDG